MGENSDRIFREFLQVFSWRQRPTHTHAEAFASLTGSSVNIRCGGWLTDLSNWLETIRSADHLDLPGKLWQHFTSLALEISAFKLEDSPDWRNVKGGYFLGRTVYTKITKIEWKASKKLIQDLQIDPTTVFCRGDALVIVSGLSLFGWFNVN